MIKTILVIVCLMVVALLIVAATKPDSFHVSRSATIHAPPPAVYALVDDFHHWPSWSPWENLDPEMQRTYGGPSSGVGAFYEWDGNRKAGQGRMEIVEAVPAERLGIRLDFLRPWKSTNQVEFEMVDLGEATQVTWSMSGPNSFIGKVMSVFMSMDGLIGKDYEEGLANLKSIAEGRGTSEEAPTVDA